MSPTFRRQTPPNYITGKKGKRWTATLRRAAARNAVIMVEELGVEVHWDPQVGSMAQFRPWVDAKGNRHDSRDCIAVF
jgi:hypothetical protein